MSRLLLLSTASLLLASALLGCNDGIDTGSDSLPIPAIAAADAPEACATPGGASIVLDMFATEVFENLPQSSTLGPHQVEISGVITGLAAGHTAYGLVIDDSAICPVISSLDLAISADGAFTKRLRISTSSGLLVTDFRVIVVTGPAGASPSCGGTGECLQLDVGGAPTGLGGISNAIGVRL